ncbi:MAG: hypothetical protein WD181_03245 [Solirubrobacterales bacterium]
MLGKAQPNPLDPVVSLMPALRTRHLTPCALASIALVVFLGFTANADAGSPLKPPGKQVFFGVTDTGETDGFHSFAKAVGKRPAVIQTFHAWGNTLSQALPRWRKVRARPMLHITTKADDGTELITPRKIALGRGDDYLLRLNLVLARQNTPAYIRPMGEPNRCRNLYSGVDCGGNVRGGDYSFSWYRSAFRRIAVIVRGGMKRGWINKQLDEIGLPKIKQRTRRPLPLKLKTAPVSMVWSPLPSGSPITGSNYPASYWPGRKWVDWVATDFYSRYSNWDHLERFYAEWSADRKLPMALTEWGLWGEDSPGYVNRIFRFMRSRERMRMLIYYQDFGSSNEFRIQNFPNSQNTLRNRLSPAIFPRFAPRFPRVPPNGNGNGGGVAPPRR